MLLLLCCRWCNKNYLDTDTLFLHLDNSFLRDMLFVMHCQMDNMPQLQCNLYMQMKMFGRWNCYTSPQGILHMQMLRWSFCTGCMFLRGMLLVHQNPQDNNVQLYNLLGIAFLHLLLQDSMSRQGIIYMCLQPKQMYSNLLFHCSRQL